MCKSALYASNIASQDIALNGVINFGTVVRRFGHNINVAGGNVNLNGAGYYDMDASFTFTSAAAGTPVITLYKDGVAITGATASVSTAANGVYTVSIPCIVREKCDGEATITAVVSGLAITVTKASIEVKKI